MSDQVTSSSLKTLATQIALELGLDVTVTAADSHASEKLGRQIRVRVFSSDKRKTWKALTAIGRELHGRGVGKVYRDKHSHYETRDGVYGGCRGYVTGSCADLRVYPEAV